MTPKEKAKELISKYVHLAKQTTGANGTIYNSKQCALITCNRTIDILKEIRDKEHSDNFWYLENAILEEMQVKTEIEKL